MTTKREVWVLENGLGEPIQSARAKGEMGDLRRIRNVASERLVRYVPGLYEQAAKEAQARAIELQGEPAVLAAQVMRLTEERDEARDWVRKLTSTERVLTCVYCGHAYPPGTPEHGAEVLTAHVVVCEKHPMRATQARLAEIESALDAIAKSPHLFDLWLDAPGEYACCSTDEKHEETADTAAGALLAFARSLGWKGPDQ